jgi:hypothetical protein
VLSIEPLDSAMHRHRQGSTATRVQSGGGERKLKLAPITETGAVFSFSICHLGSPARNLTKVGWFL